MIELSIVIPIFNESKNIKKLVNEIIANLPTKKKCEIIFVDDGSNDDSSLILYELKKKINNFKFLSLNKNYGQSTALHAGISNAEGKYVITMDGDLQNDPRDIKIFYEYIIANKLDCVFGWRKHRKEKYFFRKVISKIANIIIKKILNNSINDLGCSFKCFRREIFDQIIWSTDFHRYFSAFIVNEGFKTEELIVNHKKRNAGKSKYGYSRVFGVFIDIIFLSFVFKSLRKPLHFFGKFSLILLFFSFLCAMLAIYYKLFGIKKFTETPLPELITLLTLSSIIILFFGILSELILSLYFHLKGKRDYVTKK